jgi:hypothetical protein
MQPASHRYRSTTRPIPEASYSSHDMLPLKALLRGVIWTEGQIGPRTSRAASGPSCANGLWFWFHQSTLETFVMFASTWILTKDNKYLIVGRDVLKSPSEILLHDKRISEDLETRLCLSLRRRRGYGYTWRRGDDGLAGINDSSWGLCIMDSGGD